MHIFISLHCKHIKLNKTVKLIKYTKETDNRTLKKGANYLKLHFYNENYWSRIFSSLISAFSVLAFKDTYETYVINCQIAQDYAFFRLHLAYLLLISCTDWHLCLGEHDLLIDYLVCGLNLYFICFYLSLSFHLCFFVHCCSINQIVCFLLEIVSHFIILGSFKIESFKLFTSLSLICSDIWSYKLHLLMIYEHLRLKRSTNINNVLF